MFFIMNKWLFMAGVAAHLYKVVLTSDVKVWNKDTNFLNPRNWDNDQLPCENDRIIFPASVPVITFMPESFTARELILPVDGEILFPSNADIKVTEGNQQESCIGKDAYFMMRAYYWFEPTNWNITSKCAFPRIPNRRNAAVPHAFQVPCQTDKAIFPAGKTFSVYLNYPNTTIASIDINNMGYTQDDFNALLKTRIGTLLFADDPTIRITSSPCSNSEGCICGNDDYRVLPTICQFVTPYCPIPECSDPIKPVGSCCSICGSKITMKHGDGFTLDHLLTAFERILNQDAFRGVESFTSKTHDGNIQSVFVDTTNNKGLANRAARSIYHIITEESEESNFYGIKAAEIATSEHFGTNVPSFNSYTSTGMSPGGIAALVILLLVILAGTAFYIYKKRHVPGFNFARFDLLGEKIEIELGTTPHDELEPGDTLPVPETSEEEKSKGFDNPVYGTAVEEVSPLETESNESKDFVENPMFMIFEDSSERSKEEK